MKKIILCTTLISLIFCLCSCGNNTEVVYEEDFKKYSETKPEKIQTEEEKEFISNFTDITEESLEDVNVNFINYKTAKDIIEYKNTGIILFANMETASQQEKEIILNFIKTADGGGYPVNYYKTGQKDDKKILKELEGTISDFSTPRMIFLKDGEIVSNKTTNDFSGTSDELYQSLKEEIYKTIE